MTSQMPPVNDPVSGTPGDEAKVSRRDVLAPYVAAAILIFFGILLLYLLRQIGLPQEQWERTVYLLNGVEAIAFAATGYLFGKEVNRQRAEKAEQRAEESEVAGANGRALATLVKVKAARASRGSGLESTRSQGGATYRS